MIKIPTSLLSLPYSKQHRLGGLLGAVFFFFIVAHGSVAVGM